MGHYAERRHHIFHRGNGFERYRVGSGASTQKWLLPLGLSNQRELLRPYIHQFWSCHSQAWVVSVGVSHEWRILPRAE
jgi:hypothetical protein